WSVRRLYFRSSRYRWCYHYLSSYFIITATIWCSSIQCIHRFRTYFQSSLFQYFKWVIKSAKKTEFSPPLVIYMSGGMITGSMLVALLANLFNAAFVNTIYIIIALLALILMFINVKPNLNQSSFNKPLLVMVGLFVGIISGIVGAGGAFIIIPIL